MKPPPRRKLQFARRIGIGIVTAALFAPIAVYVSKFGITISQDHQRWGEMGSAMSGIYSPLLAFLALLVVYRQVKSQSRFNEHEVDQRYIEQSRADVQYYLEQLDRALQVRDPNGATVRQMLQQHFQPESITGLVAPQLVSIARSLNQQYPQPLSLWSAIYPILSGLQSAGRFPYEHNAVGTMQKIVAMVTFETSVTLDNLHYCLTGGKSLIKYQFSPLVEEKSEL